MVRLQVELREEGRCDATINKRTRLAVAVRMSFSSHGKESCVVSLDRNDSRHFRRAGWFAGEHFVPCFLDSLQFFFDDLLVLPKEC